MSKSFRPYPLADEIKMHVFTWAADSEWQRLPAALKDALTSVMNEIKIAEALKANGMADDRLETSAKASEKKRFVAIFKQKYLEYCDFAYNTSIDAATLYIVGALCEKLLAEGADSLEYLNWFFDEFMKDEYNKQKYAPPSIRIAVSNFVVDKYMFQNKDRLRVRRQDLLNIKARNAVLALATEYLEKSHDKVFASQTLEYSRGETGIRKFSGIFSNLLHLKGETEYEKRLKEIIDED